MAFCRIRSYYFRYIQSAASQASATAGEARETIDQLRATVVLSSDAYAQHVRTLGDDITFMKDVRNTFPDQPPSDIADHDQMVRDAQEIIDEMRNAAASDVSGYASLVGNLGGKIGELKDVRDVAADRALTAAGEARDTIGRLRADVAAKDAEIAELKRVRDNAAELARQTFEQLRNSAASNDEEHVQSLNVEITGLKSVSDVPKATKIH
eukprot:519799_1